MKKLLFILLSALLISCQQLPDIFSRDNTTTLPIYSLIFQKEDTISLFKYIDEGIDLNRRDNSGNTLLINAAYHNAFNCTSILIKEGADINIQGFNGFTPLLFSCTHPDLEVTKLLLDAGADINAQNRHGNSPLTVAIASYASEKDSLKPKFIEKIKFLIEKGANVNSKDQLGIKPLGLAKQFTDTLVISILLKTSATE